MDDSIDALSYKTKDGTVHDGYDISNGWYYTIHVFLIVYGLAYVASLVLIQNATVPHTYFKANNNGVLYSLRYTSLYWMALFFACMRIFILVSLSSLILYRSTKCCGCRYSGCSIIWATVFIITGVCVLFVFFSKEIHTKKLSWIFWDLLYYVRFLQAATESVK